MRVVETVRGALDAAQGLSRIARALERVADSLERAFPLPPPESEDESGVTYLDRTALYHLEERQERFYRDTGIRLPPGEEPPKAFNG